MNNEEQNHEQSGLSRRGFLHGIGGAGALLGMTGKAAADDAPRDADGNVIPGFEKHKDDPDAAKGWQAVSDRKVRVGIAGHGLCKFGAAFFYQNHPNVEVVAATDLDPGRCAALAKAVGAKKTYSSCEEMIKDKSIEAVYIATDAPSHARLAIMALEHGKHACSAVPAVFGFEAEDEAERLFNAVMKSGMKYMLNETSTFHAALYEKRMQYQAGALGKILYSEGEYYHDGVGVLGSYNPKNGKIDHFNKTGLEKIRVLEKTVTGLKVYLSEQDGRTSVGKWMSSWTKKEKARARAQFGAIRRAIRRNSPTASLHRLSAERV